MKTSTSIKEIMSVDFKVIGVNEQLKKAEDILFSQKFKHLPVLQKGKLVGIISKTDIKRMSFADELGEDEFEADSAIFKMLTVGQVMINKPFTLNIDASVKDAAKILSEKEFRAIPILENEKVVGMVTTKDLIKYLVTLL
ncbi:MAG: CBS domain-containing protein [Chitinophagales bacterium]